MNTIKKTPSEVVIKNNNSNKTSSTKQSLRIRLYNEFPQTEVSLDDFEEYALRRLKCLKYIERLKLKRKTIDYTTMDKKLMEELDDELVDSISHFVLRLAYCRTEDLRRWLLTHEVELLKYRLKYSADKEKIRAIKEYLTDLEPLDKKEMEMYRTKVIAASGEADGRIYRVSFTQALDLVHQRGVYLHKGRAYIPEKHLEVLVIRKFRTSMSRQLLSLSAVPMTPAMDRTKGFLDNMASIDAMKDDYDTGAVNDLKAHNVAAHLKHMPLCMAQIQLALSQEGHLKHWSRLQYGLFLKGAGLSLEDALQYFERMFTAKGFKKENAYQWRHMYGKEGKRANYPPHSCSKIINSNAPNANEHHGCPFRHNPINEVTHLLNKLGVSGQQQKPILAQLQSKNYQLACVEHFKAVHPPTPTNRIVEMDNVGNHPNAWFKASVSYSDPTGERNTPITPEGITSGEVPDTPTETVSMPMDT